MSENERIEIAGKADMIVGGYAFLGDGDFIKIVNLNKSDPHVCIIDKSGRVIESSMDPLEQVIAVKIWNSDSEFMGA